jgi:hypothetical protein
MLWGAAAALLSLFLITSPAHAEFPAALSAWAGAGAGWGHREEVRRTGTLFGYLGIEAAWRFAPGRALVATCEGAGGSASPQDGDSLGRGGLSLSCPNEVDA